MTKLEAIAFFMDMDECTYGGSEPIQMAIKALEEQDSILDLLNKIKAEIEALPKTYPFVNHIDMYVKEDDVRRIIDKYKAEREIEE